MNLSLTPLNEAYTIPKVKKPQSTNVYSNPDHQKTLLKTAKYEVTETTPSGYIGPHVESIENHKPPVEQNLEIVPQKNTGITLNITDPELVELFNDYKPDRVEKIIKKQFVKSPSMQIETFTNGLSNVCSIDSTNMIMYILLAILLIDILIRLRL